MNENLVLTLKDFGIETENLSLYEMAFTHSSYTNEHPQCPDYDRLEFLGDALLDMVVGTMVFDYYSDSDSRVLSLARSALVDGTTLSRLSESVYGLSSLVRYSKGEEKNYKNHTHINEDVFEAFIGAVYLDQGYEFVRKLIIKIFSPLLENALKLGSERDSKGRLQEKMKGAKIDYVVVEQKNLNSDSVSFVVEARYENAVLGRGEGHNIKAAEIKAAMDALNKEVGK